MTIDWSKDRVGTLSTPEILELQKNARARGVLEVVATCDLVLLTRKPIRRHSGPSVSTPTKILEAKCAKQLSDFAIHLIAKYDLSASTAAKLSEGRKGSRLIKLPRRTDKRS